MKPQFKYIPFVLQYLTDLFYDMLLINVFLIDYFIVVMWDHTFNEDPNHYHLN